MSGIAGDAGVRGSGYDRRVTELTLVLVANAGDGTISSFRLDARKLAPLAVTPGIAGCSTFVHDPERGLVHAAVKPGADGELPGILTLSLDRETGALTPLSRLDLPDGGMNYLALTRGGTGLLGASYGGGYGISAPVVDGVVGEPVSRVDFPNLHSVLPSADGAFAYFVSLGADLLAQYAITADLRLVPLEPATVSAPAGSGPRHLVVDDARDAVYVLTEFTADVLHYERDADAGTLELVGSTPAHDPAADLADSAFGLDPRGQRVIWGADLHLGSAGRRLWASERTASTLGALAVSDDARVTAPTLFTTTEPQPRGFALSPDGAYLVAAGEQSTTVSLYAVDDDRLELLQRAETGRGANWVRFV